MKASLIFNSLNLEGVNKSLLSRIIDDTDLMTFKNFQEEVIVDLKDFFKYDIEKDKEVVFHYAYVGSTKFLILEQSRNQYVFCSNYDKFLKENSLLLESFLEYKFECETGYVYESISSPDNENDDLIVADLILYSRNSKGDLEEQSAIRNVDLTNQIFENEEEFDEFLEEKFA